MRKQEKAKLNEQQNKLKAVLHENIRQFTQYKVTGNRGAKAPIRMAELQRQEDEINGIRESINKQPIKLVKNLRKRMKTYRKTGN